MPRRVQDIVPNKHRSIQDIPVERSTISAPIQPPKEKVTAKIRAQTNDMRHISKDASPSKLLNKETPPHNIPIHKEVTTKPPHHRTKNSGSKKWLYVLMGIVIVVAGVGYIASVYFSRASFTIVPKTVPISINSTYVAQNTPNKGNLTYELAAVKGSETATIAAVDGPKISITAKGKITLYNAYGSQSQRLIAGTRLSDETGRVYRLTNSVVIPGYTSSNGTNIPGSLVTAIAADQPGQSYNISHSDSVSDFKIVAYKGTAKYENIYGRLATDISGGFIGAQKNTSPVVLASTTAELQAKITASLLAQVKGTVPEGYIMYPKAYVTSFTAPVIGGADPKSATVTVQGTLYGILFKTDELVTRIAGEQAVATFDTFSYDTPGLESLDFSIANQKDFSPEKKNTLIIKLKGDALLVGSIPVETLKKKFAGLSLTETEAVFRLYKPVIEIDKSSGEVTPPWSKVPSDLSRITIKVLTK